MVRKSLPILILVALIAVACAPGPSNAQGSNSVSASPTVEAMMPASTSTPAEMMASTNTPEAMMAEGSATPEAMMSDTATPEAMMAEGSATPEAMMAATATSEGMMMSDTATPEAMAPSSGGGNMMIMAPAWTGVALTDVNSNKAFKLSDYKGKVVLVELISLNCQVCQQQQEALKAFDAAMMSGPAQEEPVIVSLDVDAMDHAADLSNYAQKNGYSWSFAIAPQSVTNGINKDLGAQYLNPASVPLIVIDKKGDANSLPLGLKTADQLKQALEPFLMK
jgi:hypothetical protein